MDMDMDSNGSHSAATATASCPMIMVFHGGHCERILWKTWVASTYVEFIFSCLAFFFMSLVYEGLKFLREYIRIREIKRVNERLSLELQAKNAADHAGCSNAQLAEIKPRKYSEQLLSSAHLLQTLITLIQVALSYLLMLVFMNYNYWLCLAVILGLSLGYFFFGWIKAEQYEHDCCQ